MINIGEVVHKGVSGLFTGFSDIIGKIKADPTKVVELDYELQKLELESQKLEFELDKIYQQDRASARDLYKNDSSLQKLFAMVFLVGYIGISCFLLYAIFFSKVFTNMDNWQVALVSTIFTAMSTKVNTICDFLFGGSKSGDDSTKTITRALRAKKKAK